jgi:hypothetical protein
MNDALDHFARATLLTDLETLPESNQRFFRAMYARDEGRRSFDDAMNMDLAAVIAEIPSDKLDWAMQQVQAAIRKLSAAGRAAAGV